MSCLQQMKLGAWRGWTQRLKRLPDASWNYRCYLLDGTFFYVGTSFVESSTILPAFVSTLTDSPLAIGAITAIRNAGYLLPQLIIAGLIQGLSRTKPLLIGAGLVNRTSLLLLALTAAFITPIQPTLALVVFFFAVVLVSVSDGISGLPWTDLLARTIPPRRRGRLLGTMQFTGGIGAFGAGFLTRALLAAPRPGYPLNYGLLFGAGLVFFALSFLCTCLLRETPGTPLPVNMRRYLRGLPAYFRQHQGFRQMMGSRVLLSSYMLALPFYVIHGQQHLGFANSMVGVFVSSQMAGAILGGLLWGHISDRYGSRRVLQAVAAALLLIPLCALASRGLLAAGTQLGVLMVYLLLFTLLGACMGGIWIGYTNYLLELVDDVSRPTYLGLMNTLSAPMGFLPIAGGWILRLTSYPLLFALTTLLVAFGVLAVWRLPQPVSPARSG